MKQVAQHNRSGAIRVLDVPAPTIRRGFVLVRTQVSVISAGTERASVESRQSSLVDRARKNPDLVAAVIEQVRQFGLVPTVRRVRGKLDSWSALGYSTAGTVIAVGDEVDQVRPGDRVACAGAGYANHAEFVLVPKNLCVRIPAGMDLEEAAYTTIGTIALQGVRQAMPTIGETVVVIGLGLIGQITVQLLKANGCAVIGIDLDPAAVALARKSGADAALHRSKDDVKKAVLQRTGGRGADAVIITAATRSDDPVQLAGDICRDKGRVVLVGDVGLKLPRGPYFAKELDFRLSRSYGPGRYDPRYEEQGHDYPLGFVRWTEQRNMAEFLRLAALRKLDLPLLTTHRFPIADAPSAYRLVAGTGKNRERFVGVLLQYPEVEADAPPMLAVCAPQPAGQRSNGGAIGFIGAGGFAQASLLPTLQAVRGVSLIGVCTANGLNTTNVARTFRFSYGTTDQRKIVDDPEIGTVFIATRHNLHAEAVVEALRAGKQVFVEKPLAMNDEELDRIIKTANAEGKKHGNSVMVGFNRRFAPLVLEMKEFFAEAAGPLALTYRINAGALPSTHWTRDPLEGGGRIIGEVCHFVDLMQHFAGAPPSAVNAVALGGGSRPAGDDDSVVITIRFEDGSVGTITYAANGDAGMPKEHLEVCSTGRSAVLNNFRMLTLYRQGTAIERKRATVDKGHHEELTRYMAAAMGGGPLPISFEESVAATRATFRVMDSLKLGTWVRV